MKRLTLLFLSISFILGLTACGSQPLSTEDIDDTNSGTEVYIADISKEEYISADPNQPTNGMLPQNPMKVATLVYMTTDISPEGLMSVYEALDMELSGDNIAVKL